MGSPEPLCVKSSSGKYVGCMVNENFEFECRIDDRCNRKFLDARLGEEIEKLSKGMTEGNGVAESIIPNENIASNLITGNAISEAGLETDLSGILEPAGNASTATEAQSTETAQVGGGLNEQQQVQSSSTLPINNASNVTQTNATMQQQTEEQSNNEIEDDKLIKSKIQRLSKIRSDVKSKSITVKQAIEQLKLEQLKDTNLDEIESEEDAAYQASKGEGAATVGNNVSSVIQQAPQLDYITKVNGSVIIRLG